MGRPGLIALLLAAAVGATDLAISSPESADSRPAFSVAIGYPIHGITVYSREGKRIRTWEERVLARDKLSHRYLRYYQPDMRPDGKALVCIRCREEWRRADRRSPESTEGAECVLSELAMEGDGDIALMAIPAGASITSPVYSPDGERVGFLEDGAAVVYSTLQREVQRTIPGVVEHHLSHPGADTQIADLSGSEPYLRWSDDGSGLFVLGRVPSPIPDLREPLPEGMSPPVGLAQIGLSSGRVSWLNLYNPSFPAGADAGQFFKVQDGIWTLSTGPLPDHDAVRALFGSPRHLVRCPVYSATRDAFFSIRHRDGWFWKMTLERCDVSSDVCRPVRTLERRLYSE